MQWFGDLKTWQKFALVFFAIHSALVILNFVWAFFISDSDTSWVIVAIFVRFVDWPVYYLLVLSERLFPHGEFGSLSDYLVHPIGLIFGGLFYALLGSLLGLMVGKLKTEQRSDKSL